MHIYFKRSALFSKNTPISIIRYAAAIIPASMLLLTGCSHTEQPAAAPPGDASVKVGGPQTAATIQSDIDKVNSNPNLSSAQKQIMLAQMQNAKARATGAK